MQRMRSIGKSGKKHARATLIAQSVLVETVCNTVQGRGGTSQRMERLTRSGMHAMHGVATSAVKEAQRQVGQRRIQIMTTWDSSAITASFGVLMTHRMPLLELKLTVEIIKVSLE